MRVDKTGDWEALKFAKYRKNGVLFKIVKKYVYLIQEVGRNNTQVMGIG